MTRLNFLLSVVFDHGGTDAVGHGGADAVGHCISLLCTLISYEITKFEQK